MCNSCALFGYPFNNDTSASDYPLAAAMAASVITAKSFIFLAFQLRRPASITSSTGTMLDYKVSTVICSHFELVRRQVVRWSGWLILVHVDSHLLTFRHAHTDPETRLDTHFVPCFRFSLLPLSSDCSSTAPCVRALTAAPALL